MPGVDLHSYMVMLRDFVVNWWPLLGLTFYCVLLYIFWRMLQLMPRVKPATVMVDPRTAIEWADIAGADEAKAELLEIVEFLRDPKRFEDLGAVVPKGVLLYGPPGTGKTLLARAAANESGAKFYAQSASAFVEMFAGLGAARIRKLFDEARKHAPSIIFIDELDAVGAARTGHGFNREQDQTLNQLLVELDGFSQTAQVVVMGASNRLQDLDPALLRPGRFDRQMLVAPPDLAGRTGADLANIANEAAIFAGRQQLQYIRHVDFEGAMERIVAGLQQRRVVTDKEKRILAYHEGGHALMAHLMGELMQLQKVSIVARGDALGYAYYLPEDERYLRTKEELVDMMKVALAGRAAEQIVFGRVTNGASNDLEKVTTLARQMVFEFGMSEVATSRTMRADNYALSEETKALRDQEQARLTDEAYDEALRLLFKHRGPLDRVAAMLLEKETLVREEVLQLLTDVQPESSASETVGTPQAVIPL